MGQLQKLGVTPQLMLAYNGHDEHFPFYKYRSHSRGKWWDDDTLFKPGAFACYMSHAECWKTIVKGNDPFALILEDDIIIDEKVFKEFSLDEAEELFDVIFVNQGVTRLVDISSFNDDTKGQTFLASDELLIDLLIHERFSDTLTPGAYGYIVSKKGASKLLQVMEREKICMGVDYAIVFNSLSEMHLKIIKTSKVVPRYLGIHLRNLDETKFRAGKEKSFLKSFIYNNGPLVYHDNGGESSIKHGVLTGFGVFQLSMLEITRLCFKNILAKFFRKEYP